MLYLERIADPLVILVGPTAVGKTELAIQCARQLDAEIVSADSRLFYRGMDIGTAKPTLAERKGVPHHLIDVTDAAQPWSLVDFQRAARQAIAGIHARGRLPILVGGTGQYVRALLEDWKAPPQEPDRRLRTTLENWGRQIGARELHRRLGCIDPSAAAKIEPNNLRRSVRALEVIFSTGELFSRQKESGPAIYSICMIGLRRPRQELYARIDRRIDQMVRNGLREEVQALLERGIAPDQPALSAIGYREMVGVIQGRLSQEEAILEMKRLTHQFVRRQANWYKETDPPIHCFDAGERPVGQMVECIKNIENWEIFR